MKLFERKKYNNGKREVYFCGLKVFSYNKLSCGIIDYNALPLTESVKYEENISPVISIVYPVYYTHKNKENFISLIERYDKYSSEVKSKFEIIIIDDGSKYPLTLPKSNLNISLLRIEKDFPWNNSGARNLGACYATTPKLVMLDADWFVPEETLLKCIDIKLSNNDIMPLKWTTDSTIPPQRVLPNLFCINKQTFFKFNCYDEQWCGSYGEDLFYRKYIQSNGINSVITNHFLLPHGKNYVTNDSHNLSRNARAALRKVSKIKNLYHSKRILKFPWALVSQQYYLPENNSKNRIAVVTERENR